MAIKKAPLKTDAAGKCSRWRVIVYNPATHKQEWHTVEGTRRDAEAFERAQKTKLASGTYIAKSARQTFGQIAEAFLTERRARGRRTSTLADYQSILNAHLMPIGDGGVRGGLAPREAGSLRKSDFRDHFARMRAAGASDSVLDKCVRTAKAILNFALDEDPPLIERNVLQRFRPYTVADPDRRQVSRDAFTELEVRQLLNEARPGERALIALLCFTGARPGEVYALDWSAIDLDGGSLRIERSWDHRGAKFVAPKTKAGRRTVPLSGWLVDELKAHRACTGGDGLVFANGNGRPLNPSNVRRDVWLPLLERAGVPYRDMYSLRSTFASLARASGEAAFNVSRMMGHSRSTLVDQAYAKTLQSGLTSVASAVAARVLGEQPPKLRVIEGGARAVRESLESSDQGVEKNAVNR